MACDARIALGFMSFDRRNLLSTVRRNIARGLHEFDQGQHFIRAWISHAASGPLF